MQQSALKIDKPDPINQASSLITPPQKKQRSTELNALSLYLKEVEKYTLLTAEEEIHYGRLVQQGDSDAREVMITSNLRFVVKVARKYNNRGIALLDLIEEGNLGLIHAVRKFDPEKGFRFSTYSSWWIKEYIEHALMSQSRTVRLPIHTNKLYHKYSRIKKQLSQAKGGNPSMQDIASAMDETIDKISSIEKVFERTSSLDIQTNDDSNNSMVDLIAEENQITPEDSFDEQAIRQHIKLFLDELSERQRDVIVRRFGLEGHDFTTLESTGVALGITRERVRQIQVEALDKMRKHISKQSMSRDHLMR